MASRNHRAARRTFYHRGCSAGRTGCEYQLRGRFTLARPRVFVSSTFYDLRHVRNELEEFMRGMGCEPVQYERGQVPYPKDRSLETSCYREVTTCDILVSVIGGRYGTQSDQSPYSISQRELKQAIEDNKQVYIFIERDVDAEYQTYLRNKGTDVHYSHVDDVRVYKFIEEVRSLPINNPIFPFEGAQEIVTYLREQSAGLFKELLERQTMMPQMNAIAEVRAAADSLNQLVQYLLAERENTDGTIQHILLSNHPVFARLNELLGAGYRIYFTSIDEMTNWLRARRYVPCDPDPFSDEPQEFRIYMEEDQRNRLKISASLFDSDGKLKPMSPEDWSDSLAETYAVSSGLETDMDYDPFTTP